ncbi:hypothetical protein MNEG_2827 [Monoraphidium neglectum]|jgi:hypothetical protein|uniref:Uncharacterized protein n=1 Tax=Monoraphidium neglectum TaxID=145388 RepID=A0A0D2K3Z6_9CHLO|nr:hypothetical protein MNEG_2827 [Monoraphidium neglectum]KIZ05133.1 hypothetical protein MNEG_2827 [Monoraphidium neglectum]|eukprot:XP_013904152.1 hypothetical protein MNEG_2827 [Monoraphidium neglectum]
MQPEATSSVDVPKAAAPAPARKAIARFGKGAWSSFGKGATAFGSMFKGPEKPLPEQTMELQEMSGHRKSASLSSSVVSSDLEQSI